MVTIMTKDFCSPPCMKMDMHYYLQISEVGVNWSRNFIEMNVILRTKRTREIPFRTPDCFMRYFLHWTHGKKAFRPVWRNG